MVQKVPFVFYRKISLKQIAIWPAISHKSQQILPFIYIFSLTMTKDINFGTNGSCHESESVALDGENSLETDRSLVASKEVANVPLESNGVSLEAVKVLGSKDPSEEPVKFPDIVNYTQKGKEI